jgi:hypothetical protein
LEEEDYFEAARKELATYDQRRMDARGADHGILKRTKGIWIAHKVGETRIWAKVQADSQATVEEIQRTVQEWELERWEALMDFEVDERRTDPSKRIYAYVDRHSSSEETDDEEWLDGQMPDAEQVRRWKEMDRGPG